MFKSTATEKAKYVVHDFRLGAGGTTVMIRRRSSLEVTDSHSSLSTESPYWSMRRKKQHWRELSQPKRFVPRSAYLVVYANELALYGHNFSLRSR